MQVNVYATLRDVVGGATAELDLAVAPTVREVVDALVAKYPPLRPKLMDDGGELLGAVHVFVNGRDGHYLPDGLTTRITPTDRIDIFPAVGGG
ncbi:MAG: MoaD/ThiS family protein [Anaerolineae bacterium]|nr:MoaD/ThiS family protein [Anaerolineae bacterium]